MKLLVAELLGGVPSAAGMPCSRALLLRTRSQHAM